MTTDGVARWGDGDATIRRYWSACKQQCGRVRGSRSKRTKNNDLSFHDQSWGRKRRASSTHTVEVKSLYSLRLALGLIRKTSFPPRLQHGCALWSTQGILPVWRSINTTTYNRSLFFALIEGPLLWKLSAIWANKIALFLLNRFA